MMAFMKKLMRDKRGNALLIAAAVLPLVIGSAGLASDTIQWTLWKRQLQRAADSAAIAGVYARMAAQDVNTQVNNDLTKNNHTGITLLAAPTIGFPANGGNFNNAVSVGIQLQKRLGFSSVFMSAAPIVIANATAAAVATGNYCVVSLESTSTTGITAGGNATVNLGCGMITNSTSMDAAIAFGSSSVSASPVAAVGGLDQTDNWASGTTLLPFTLKQQDPFASIDPPPVPSPCNTQFSDSPQANSAPPAGCYKSMTFKGNVTLSGQYIVTGDVSFDAQTVVTCASCTFILTDDPASSTGKLDIGAGAQLNLAAEPTGPYAGILFYQNRGATANVVNKVNGNSSSTFQGAFYFPNQEVEFQGTAGLTYNCLKLVSRKVTFTGNSTITNNCPANSGVPDIQGRHVRLVA